MSISTSKEKLAEIVSAMTSPDVSQSKLVFRGLEFDSRNIHGGELFVALKGEHVHGEKFLDQAFSRGAALALVEDQQLLSTSPHAHSLVAVPDSLKAMWTLAQWWRQETNLPVLGITGSVGKTTVKELSAAVLMTSGVGTYAQKSFNNHVGVPYTVCKMHRDHRWAVIEMGMNHAGEISNLTRIAQPNVAAITAIAAAHIEHFSGIEGIARAKLEILEGLTAGGAIVLNQDDAVLMSEWNKISDKRPVQFFGTSVKADCQVRNIESRGLDGISFVLRLFSDEVSVRMSVLGRQYALNAACAVLACKALLPHISIEGMAKALESFQAPLMRLNQHELKDGRIIIDDSYNANPASMRAMLELARDVVNSGKKVGVVLGDMRELGASSEVHHQEIAELAAAVKPTCVIAVGHYAKLYSDAARAAGYESFHTQDVAAAAAQAQTQAWDILFVKGSRAIGLDAVVRKILESD